MYIQVESNDFNEMARCYLCGTVFRPTEVMARAYDETDKFLTDVCPECVAAGPEGISKRLQHHAASLRQAANQLESLSRGEIQSPSPAEFRVRAQLLKTFL